MEAACISSLRRTERATGGWTIVLLESVARLLSAFIRLSRFPSPARAATKREHCWPKTLIQARRRRRPNVLPSSRVRTHLRLSPGNGSTTSAIDWRLGTVPCSLPVSKQIFSRRSGHSLLPTLTHLNCWRHLGKLRSVG